jgi:hypothetical protein
VRFYKAPAGQEKAKGNGNGDGNGQGNGNGNGQGNGHNGNGPELELWTVSDGNGLQILRFTDNFKAQHKDLGGSWRIDKICRTRTHKRHAIEVLEDPPRRVLLVCVVR